MKARTAACSVLLLSLVLGLASLGLSAPESAAQGPGVKPCLWCDLDACGCVPPPEGCALIFSCACSSIDCKRSCTFQCEY
jgi:hypothetical protein